jgi:selenocysteine lyase/cysteine desulfurase
MVHPPDGRRYEAGTANLVGLAGLHAAMQMLLELGVENIARELLRKRAWLVPALQERGYEVLYANAEPEAASGIVTFHRPGTDLAALHEKLTTAKIVTSLRGNRQGSRYIRLSPHFYNSEAELHRLLELL